MTVSRIKIALLKLLVLGTLMFSAGSSLAATEIVTYYVNDALGSPIMALNQAGDVIWQESYQPYGQRQIKSVASQADEQFYTGKQEEPDIGLQYYGARWYDPEAGRFTSIDPVGVDEGNIHSFNRYAYANNNPYKYVDPDGKQGVSVNVPIASVNVDSGYQPYSGSSLGLGNAAHDIRKFSNDMMIAVGSALAIEFSPLIISQISIWGKAGSVAKSGLPSKADDLLKQGYKDVSHPDAAKVGHRTFENPTSSDKVRFDQGKPGQPGYEGQDHYHRYNPDATGKKDMYLDKNGNSCARGCDASHLFPGD